MSDQPVKTPMRDSVKAALELMQQGARMFLSDIPGDSSMLSMSCSGTVSKAVATALAEAKATIARQQAMLDRALEASFDDKARADRAEAEIERLKDPRTAARLICDEVLQKPSDEAAAMREAMVKATMGTKVPALTGEVRWSVVNDALRALAALARPHATKGEAG